MEGFGTCGLILLFATLSATAAIARFLQLAYRAGRVSSERRTRLCKTLIVMGSGGHTMEMLRLLGGLAPDRYSPRLYVVAETDAMSLEKVLNFECDRGLTARVMRVPRAREVKQSYLTSVPSTLYAGLCSLPLVLKACPDLVLCNGPGTCIPVCLCAYLLKFLGLKDSKIVYVESVCRVTSLSLSGLILYYLADHLLVQWPKLKDLYARTQYIGRII